MLFQHQRSSVKNAVAVVQAVAAMERLAHTGRRGRRSRHANPHHPPAAEEPGDDHAADQQPEDDEQEVVLAVDRADRDEDGDEGVDEPRALQGRSPLRGRVDCTGSGSGHAGSGRKGERGNVDHRGSCAAGGRSVPRNNPPAKISGAGRPPARAGIPAARSSPTASCGTRRPASRCGSARCTSPGCSARPAPARR